MTKELRTDDGRYVAVQRDDALVVYDTTGRNGWIAVWDRRTHEIEARTLIAQPLPPDPPRIGH